MDGKDLKLSFIEFNQKLPIARRNLAFYRIKYMLHRPLNQVYKKSLSKTFQINVKNIIEPQVGQLDQGSMDVSGNAFYPCI